MPASYKSGEDIDTPYAKARQVWDQRLGSATVQAANWRLMSFCLLGIIVCMGIGMAYLGSKAKIVPYVVEVGPYGDFQAKGLATEYHYSASAVLEKYFVLNFVQSVRTISRDDVVNAEKIKGAYAFLTKRSAEMLNAINRENDPLAESRRISRSINIETILPISKNMYQVDWMEIENDRETGERTKAQSYRGVFTIVSRTPTSEMEVRQNPLGIYIDHFSWQVRR